MEDRERTAEEKSLSLIERLDAQQNDVMSQLDHLNEKIEQMLAQLSDKREVEMA